jgi:PAS domain S-box-containing protein
MNNRLAVALDASSAGTWDWDIAARHVEWSAKKFEIFGLDPQKTVASFEVWQNIIHPQDRDLARSRIGQALKEHATLVDEYRILLPDGQIRWINTLGRATYDDRGRPMRMTGISMDITERKKAEQLKDEFIGMVSHELRTPLTVVTGALYASMTKEIPDEEKQQLMQDALWGAEMLDQILENLLELSRAQANRLRLNIHNVNIADVARNVVNRLEYKSAGHRFEIDIAPELVVQADPVRIELVLRNLLDNAIKYSPSGGQIRAFARQDADNMVIGISDQGSGISSEDQEKLFARFQRLERSVHAGAEGIGLGLSVCRTLVEAHRGRIWVKSEPGRGSTFFFTIPVNPKPTGAGNTAG